MVNQFWQDFKKKVMNCTKIFSLPGKQTLPFHRLGGYPFAIDANLRRACGGSIRVGPQRASTWQLFHWALPLNSASPLLWRTDGHSASQQEVHSLCRSENRFKKKLGRCRWRKIAAGGAEIARSRPCEEILRQI